MAPPLDVFYGGFLYNSCCPLEMRLNWCSHNCYYCFANLEEPDRKVNPISITNQLSKYQDSDTYLSYLMRESYPTVISNHVDPFAASNDRLALPILETMAEMGLPVMILTKGGKRFYEALDLFPTQTIFYFSVETDNADITRKIAPGAPIPSDRLNMIEAAIERGHKVEVGINPLVPEWLPDPTALAKQLHSIGVWGVILQAMHLSRSQLANMPDVGKESLGEQVISDALMGRRCTKNQDHVAKTRDICLEVGLEVYQNQQGDRSDYFQHYRDVYSKTFPLMQDWVNWCYDNKRSGDGLYFSEFASVMLPKLPNGRFPLVHHIHSTVHPKALGGLRIPRHMTYEELLKLIWQHKQTVFCPANVECFAFAADWEKQSNGKMGWTLWLDDDDLPIMVFKPEGTWRSAYIQWSP